MSNNGQTDIDPLDLGSAALSAPETSVPEAVQGSATPTQWPGNHSGSDRSSAARFSPLKIAIPVILAAVAAVVVFAVIGGGDSNRFGVINSVEAQRGEVASFEYKLSKGDLIRYRAEPERGLDITITVLTEKSVAERWIRNYEDLIERGITLRGLGVSGRALGVDAADVLDNVNLGRLSRLVLVQHTDIDLDNGVEADRLLVVADGTYHIVVSSYNGDAQVSGRLIVEKAKTRANFDRFESEMDFFDFTERENEFIGEFRFFDSGRNYQR